MRKELSHLTMSARSRTAARVVKIGTGRLVRETLPQQTRAQSHSHPFLLDLFRARMLERFQVCDRLSIVSPHFWLLFFSHPQADPSKPRTVAARRPA